LIARKCGTNRLIDQRIELAGLDISFELAIPGLGVKRGIRRTERGKLCGRKLFNLLLLAERYSASDAGFIGCF
jgi:hypothetical protein